MERAGAKLTSKSQVERPKLPRIRQETTRNPASRKPSAIVSNLDLLLYATEACPHGLALKRGGRVVFANPSYAHLLGYRSASAVIGKHEHALKKCRNGKDRSGPELEAIDFAFRHGGHYLRLEILRDVAERRRLERQLREAQKMEALGRAVGGVAHDFNNLLTAVMLYCDLLRQQVPDGPGRRHTDEVKLAAQRGASLVRQLLAFARQQVLEPQVLSLNAVALGMRDMLQRLLGENIELVACCAESLSAVKVDPGQMQQVLLNLVMNARDAMPAGGRVVIETANVNVDGATGRRHHGLRAGRYVRLTVTDTGCGMDRDATSHAFEPFFTTKPKGKGTGLGLATVYGIITQSGGTVTLDSTPGKGTTVAIMLPSTVRTPQWRPEPRAKHDPLVSRDQSAKTVLLAEDDAAVNESTAQLLERAGHRVLRARSGEHAVHIADEHRDPIQVFICDLVLPGMSGPETALRLRAERPDMAVIYTSGYGDKVQSAGAAEVGAVILQKPFTQATLTRTIAEALALVEVRDEARLSVRANGRNNAKHS